MVSAWAVFQTGLAPGSGHQIRTLTAGGPQMLAIPQPLPCLRRLKVAPAAEVGVITLVRASWEMRHTSGGDEEQRSTRRRGGALLCTPVWAELAAHVTKLTVSHVINVHAIQAKAEGLHSLQGFPATTCR